MDTPEFSDDMLLTICEVANVVACECPAHLVGLLRQIRQFRYYTLECIDRFPEDEQTHQWLSEQILQIEARLSQLIFEFMQREDLLDEQQKLDFDRLAERSYQASLRIL
jgi:hypothetical protein